MKRVRAVTVALLFLVLGAGVQAYARQDQQDEKQTKPEKTRQAGSRPNLYTVTPLPILTSATSRSSQRHPKAFCSFDRP